MISIDRLLPQWLRAYPRQHLSADVVAGLVVTILVLPQSLAYALLAGLPPQMGLYASILPALVYAWVGSSMTQAVGPAAITAMMTYSVLHPLAQAGTPHYLEMAATLALLSGALVFAFGMLRMGFLASLLSRPVISGFIAGSAVLIMLNQIPLLLDVPAAGVSTWAKLASVASQLQHLNGAALLLGGLTMVLLLLSRNGLAPMLIRRGVAAQTAALLVRLVPLLMVLMSTFAVFVWELDARYQVKVIGKIQGGLPEISWGAIDLSESSTLLIPALLLALIGMAQNIAMAQSLAMKRREKVDANRELVGLGLSNVAASVFGGMPVGGGVTRSAVNLAAGAQTPLASIVAGLGMLAIVWVGPSWLERIPLAVLAGSISVAAISMVDVTEVRRAWVYDRADAGAFMGTALGVLVLGLVPGIALGIGLGLLTFLYRASTPHIAVVGRIGHTEHFRNVDRHGVETLPGVLFLRIDESMFFGNLLAIESRLLAEVTKAPELHDVVLIMSAVNRIDLSALEKLAEIEQDFRGRGVTLHLAEIKGPLQDRMLATEFWQTMRGRIHLSANAAFEILQ